MSTGFSFLVVISHENRTHGDYIIMQHKLFTSKRVAIIHNTHILGAGSYLVLLFILNSQDGIPIERSINKH